MQPFRPRGAAALAVEEPLHVPQVGEHAPAPQADASIPTDLSAAKKKKKAPAKVKEEYLKAAPGTGPSGPKK